MLKITIISGGQTGADRGGLDAAREIGLRWGGWAPQGWIDENGVIPEEYRKTDGLDGLEEFGPSGNGKPKLKPATAYRKRTQKNVIFSDGTLLICQNAKQFDNSRGTKLTRRICEDLVKPVFLVLLDERYKSDLRSVRAWIIGKGNRIQVMNIAGPRESRARGLQADTKKFLVELLKGYSST